MSNNATVPPVRDLDAIHAGACSARALPTDGRCVPLARRTVRRIAAGLGLTPEQVDDLEVVTSELATNAVRHGGRRRHHDGRAVAGLPELWVYLRGFAPVELVVTVFDAGPGWADVSSAAAGEESDDLTEDGRGLRLVTGLADEAGGRWGRHPSRARLGRSRVPGTAVWAAFPAPDITRACVETTPGVAILRLEALLRSRGLCRLYGHAVGDGAVLSIRREVTVWLRAGEFHLRHPAGDEHLGELGDVVDVAEQVLAAAERAARTRTDAPVPEPLCDPRPGPVDTGMLHRALDGLRDLG